MNRILIFITVFFLNFFMLNAEVVNKVEINGNKRVSDETIKVYGNIKKVGSEYSKADLDQILKDLYSTNFFENIDIQIINNILKINLKEYPIINELVVIGEPSKKFSEEIRKIISSKEKGSFIESNLNNDMRLIKELYASLGYNFSEVDAKIRKIDKDNIDLVFSIERGKVTRISKISFTGDKKIKDKRLRDIIASQEDKFWKIISKNTKFSESLINLDKRLLINYYKSIGFYDVEVTSASAEIQKTANINLTYTINAGQRYIINKISTKVDKVFDKEIFFPLNDEYKKITGGYYSPFKVKKILDEIDEIIEKNNLQFVEHQVQETIENNTISLTFNIKEGEKILVERINILGNNVTNETVIRGELELDEGDPFTELGLDKTIANLKSRKLFKTVEKEVEDGSSKDLKVINIRVEEQPTGEISAGAGIGTNGGSFAFNVKENNWLGEGKKVGLEFELSEESIKGELSYVDPNYDLLGNAITYKLANITNDRPNQGYENSLFIASIGTGFEQYKDIFTNIGVTLSHDDLRTDSSASNSLKKQKGEFSEISAEYGLTFDQRNRSFMPTDGFLTRFSQSIPIYADKPFIGNTFLTSNYHSFNENFVGAAKFYLDTIHGLNDEDVRISKRRSLSSNRLRGFEKGKVGPIDGEDHVGGNYAVALNLEASLPNLLPDNTNADVGLFLDFANVWGVDYDSTIDDSNKLRTSTGVAMNWISPVGPMSFVLATNLSKASTDVTQTFNFQLGTSF